MNDYIRIPNQGRIVSTLRLLYEMSLADDYADKNGYYTKRDIAEIAANALLVTTGSSIGNEVVNRLDEGNDESLNSPLQNAKMRMQLLRMLGLVSTDYDSEIYAIIDPIFNLINPQSPNKAVLLELFMNISTSTEVYEHNCNINFHCYPGYAICYSLANLDYKIATDEMPIIMTYDIRDVDEFINKVKTYRTAGQKFPTTDPHYPKTQKNTPLNQISNLTRMSNQILRFCGIIKGKQEGIYYVCTDEGKKYVDSIKSDFKKLKFLQPYEFRKLKIGKQKEICINFEKKLTDISQGKPFKRDLVFSPFQQIQETSADWLTNRMIRKHPEAKDNIVSTLNTKAQYNEIEIKTIHSASLSKKITSAEEDIVNLITEGVLSEKSDDEIINAISELHINDNKDVFYPFIHSLLRIIGLECFGEIGRYDGLCRFGTHKIPVEIKTYNETHSYNLKGIRQAIENKICSYNNYLKDDLEYSSLVVGFNHPTEDDGTKYLIESAKKFFNIKIIAVDLKSLLRMCVDTIRHHNTVDLGDLLTKHGTLKI